MKSYIVKQKDLNSRMLSRSGGIFAAISDQVLAQGGVIYGAGMDKNFNVVHKRAVNATERDELRGSKCVMVFRVQEFGMIIRRMWNENIMGK